MKNRYAVVDLEATGTGSDARIIQVGIVVIEDGQIVNQYETDINPHEPISKHIQDLTGLTNERLVQAPSFGQVAARIYDLIGEAVFVAHNVRFDANLLAEELFFEGFELRTPRVDTVELAQLFYPTFEKYNLSYLAKELNIELAHAHTAIADAHATALLFLKIQQKIASLPKQTIGQILSFGDSLLYETRIAIEEVYGGMSDYPADAYREVGGLFLKKEDRVLEKRALSSDFDSNLAVLGLDERPLQAAFAACVEKRLEEEGQVHFIQAQAGIGKTYGYLLPLLAKLQKQLLVSVPTKILQDQIMEKEGRQLQDTFGVSIGSLKSPRHYIKLDVFYDLLQREDSNRLFNRLKQQVLVWLCETETGDLTELKQQYRLPSFYDAIRHDGFLAINSLFVDGDFVKQIQKKAQESQILLTNHSYLLHHIKDQAYLMENRILVIDEAQKLLLTAEELSNHEQPLSSLLTELEEAGQKAQDMLQKRLYESCLFELSHLMERHKKGETLMRVTGELKQVQQNLLELTTLSPRLANLHWMLDFYEQFWIEKERTTGEFLFKATQFDLLNVSELLPQTKIFCISATLELSKKLRISDLLGFKEVTSDKLDHQQQPNQAVYLVGDSPDLVELTAVEQADYICQQLILLQALKRPILVLFTSIATLLAVSDALEEKAIAHLAQHRDGEESLLKRRFEKGETQLLLGTGLFWEGVDFAKQTEVIQVISRLPFENPKDFFVQKINRYLKHQGKQPFYDYGLPMMLLRLRQAIGRTKRYEGQFSAVVILDNRTKTKRYSRQIRSFIKKEYQTKEVVQEELFSSLKEFFEKKQ
ncbi:bifunctional DnaQ family exonuclease/ATP-dependent helicase [Streptococcus cameli]